MKVDLNEKQRVMILSCINERLKVYNKSLEDEINLIKPDKEWVKAYQTRIETIKQLQEIIQFK